MKVFYLKESLKIINKKTNIKDNDVKIKKKKKPTLKIHHYKYFGDIEKEDLFHLKFYEKKNIKNFKKYNEKENKDSEFYYNLSNLNFKKKYKIYFKYD